jgi:hypothetical protein
MLFIHAQEHFRVTLGTEGVSLPSQVISKLTEVVDLAIEDKSDGPVLIKKRLLSGCQVDDPKTPVKENRLSVWRLKDARTVWSPVSHPLPGTQQLQRFWKSPSSEFEGSRYSAHPPRNSVQIQ